MEDGVGVWVFVVVAMYIAFCVVVSNMAGRRGRNKGGWVVFSICLSPLLAMIVLLCLGETDEYKHQKNMREEELRHQKIIREEELRRAVRGRE